MLMMLLVVCGIGVADVGGGDVADDVRGGGGGGGEMEKK